ncbi:hypothetical protein BVY01_05285 [bacterium I07]|nr:hypothetical protein BVY01_05285 [bacterium I07]
MSLLSFTSPQALSNSLSRPFTGQGQVGFGLTPTYAPAGMRSSSGSVNVLDRVVNRLSNPEPVTNGPTVSSLLNMPKIREIFD